MPPSGKASVSISSGGRLKPRPPPRPPPAPWPAPRAGSCADGPGPKATAAVSTVAAIKIPYRIRFTTPVITLRLGCRACRRLAEPGRRRAAGEQLAAIGKRDRLGVRHGLSGFRAIAFDFHRRARRDRILPPAHAEEGIGRTHFEPPLNHLSIRPLHVNIDPGMGVDPVHLADRSIDGDRLVGIEFSSEGMMRDGRAIDRQHRNECGQDAKHGLHGLISCLLPRIRYRLVDARPGANSKPKTFGRTWLPSAHANSISSVSALAA